MKMNTFAQGEIYVRKIDKLPDGLIEFKEKNKGDWIISHGKTGHHHLLDGDGVTVMERTKDVPAGMRILYGIIEKPAKLRQEAANSHETHALVEGFYEFRIAREYDPFTEQARRVAD